MGKSIGRLLWWGLAFALIALAGAGLWSRPRDSAGRLPVLYSVPEFSLTERSGRRVNRSELLGKVWVADFIYTHCKDTCPLQTTEMAHLQADFAASAEFRLVSVTIDPDRDTAKVLAEFANRAGASPERWLFLTGARERVHALVRKGFRLSVAISGEGRDSSRLRIRPRDRRRKEPPKFAVTPAAGARRASVRDLSARLLRLFSPAPAWAHHPTEVDPKFTHSSRFVLVDRKANIRGYYHSDDPADLKRIRQDVKRLL